MDAKGEGVLLYYKFAFVPEPQTLGLWFQTLCSSLNLVGRVRVAPDGVNVTIGGPLISLSKHIDAVKAHPWLGDCDFKLAPACTTALNRSSIASEVGFGSLSVRIVKELVTLGIHPSESLSISDAGVHLSPIEFHRKIEAECTHTSISNGVDSIDLNDPVSLAGESKIQNAVIASFESDGNVSHGYPGQDNSKMIILDVRNIYETRIGKFVPPEDIECLDPQIRQYSDLPQWIDSNAERLRNKSILMYCTGGVRCEMASAYIKKKGSGFQNVFQLSGGIQRYLETFPDGGFFKGKNFVFDHRVAVPSVCPDILGACTKCGVPFDDYTSRVRCSHCRMLVLVCNDCQARLVSEGQPQTQLCEICTANKSVKNCDLNNQLVLTSNGMCPDKAVHLEKSNESTNRHISAGCTDLRVSANGAVRRKLRILCLHGFRQSASSLKGRLAAFTKKLKGFAEFVFIDAPHEVPLIVTNAKENDYGQSTSRCQTAGKMPGKKFAWLVTPEMTSRTSSAVLVSDTILMSRNERGFDKDQYKRQTLGWISSLRKLEEVFNDQGRFDGVLGFSQGAAVAASLCISSESTLQEKSSIKFRFAILCSGFISPASEMQDLMAHVSLPLKCPSLHIYADSGGHDRQIVNTDSMQLKALFDPGTAMVLTHNLGHILPSHRDDMEKVKQFLSQFI